MAKSVVDTNLNGLKQLNSYDLDYEETDEEKNLNAILRKFKSSNGILKHFNFWISKWHVVSFFVTESLRYRYITFTPLLPLHR